MLLSFTTSDVLIFGIALLSMGFGFGIFFPLTLEIVLSKIPQNKRGSMIGAYEALFGMGWVIGPITAGMISQFQDSSAPYAVFFVIGIGVTILSIIRRGVLQPQRNTNL